MSALSLMVSATMWRAPSSASSTLATPFSASTKDAANVSSGVPRRLLIPEIIRERLQALFPRDHGLGAALGLVGKVQIFELTLVERLVDARLQLVGQLALFLNGGEDGLFAGNQLAEIEELFFDGADLDFVEIAGRLLAIAGDEGDGGALVQKFDCGHETLQSEPERTGNMNQKIGR